MTVVIINIPAVGVGDLELRSGDERAGHAVLLLDDQCASPLVPERQLLCLACFDEDVLRRPVQNETFHGLDLPYFHSRTGFQMRLR